MDCDLQWWWHGRWGYNGRLTARIDVPVKAQLHTFGRIETPCWPVIGCTTGLSWIAPDG